MIGIIIAADPIQGTFNWPIQFKMMSLERASLEDRSGGKKELFGKGSERLV